jgi:hypothetical protein
MVVLGHVASYGSQPAQTPKPAYQPAASVTTQYEVFGFASWVGEVLWAVLWLTRKKPAPSQGGLSQQLLASRSYKNNTGSNNTPFFSVWDNCNYLPLANNINTKQTQE